MLLLSLDVLDDCLGMFWIFGFYAVSLVGSKERS